MRPSLMPLFALGAAPVLASPPTPADAAEQRQVKDELGLSIDALVAALPACVLGPRDGALVLDPGCVGELCADTPVPTALQALQPNCTEGRASPDGQLRCDTPGGLSFFDSRESALRRRDHVHAFYLTPPYAGHTTTGLGLGVSLGCFLQELGTPSHVEIEREGDRFAISELSFDAPKLTVQAEEGVVDRLVIYEPKGTCDAARRPPGR